MGFLSALAALPITSLIYHQVFLFIKEAIIHAYRAAQ
jgi:hypothetical protein